jgi:hypothetical protein
VTKKLSLEDVLVEMWEGVHATHSVLSGFNDDTFAGYITAMSMAQEPRINKLGVGLTEVYNTVKRLMWEQKL